MHYEISVEVARGVSHVTFTASRKSFPVVCLGVGLGVGL